MNKIAILLKTYVGDLKYVDRMIKSYNKHNKNNIPLYIVAPESDCAVFKQYVNENVALYSDESITSDLVSDDSVCGIRPGYVNQEIIKLSFWKKGVCENYFCMDSDGVFIRDFYVSDFMYDKDTPYTVLVEDNELIVEPEYFNRYWESRKNNIRLIQKKLEFVDDRMLTCHGFAILSTKVLKSLDEKYMQPNKLTYVDLLKIAPYEYSWYNMWLQKDKTIPIEIKEHIFKYFHHANHHIEYLDKNITLNDIARGYMGVVVNSNYSRGLGVVSYEDGCVYELTMNEIRVKAKNLLLMIKVSLVQKMKRKILQVYRFVFN